MPSFKVAKATEVPPGQRLVVQAGTKTLALFNVEGVYHAIDNTCPHRGAQRRNAIGRGIAVMAVGQCLPARLDDMIGGREIGLADPQIDDRAALRRQRVGSRQYLEGGFGAEHRHAAGHLQHWDSP